MRTLTWARTPTARPRPRTTCLCGGLRPGPARTMCASCSPHTAWSSVSGWVGGARWGVLQRGPGSSWHCWHQGRGQGGGDGMQANPPQSPCSARSVGCQCKRSCGWRPLHLPRPFWVRLAAHSGSCFWPYDSGSAHGLSPPQVLHHGDQSGQGGAALVRLGSVEEAGQAVSCAHRQNHLLCVCSSMNEQPLPSHPMLRLDYGWLVVCGGWWRVLTSTLDCGVQMHGCLRILCTHTSQLSLDVGTPKVVALNGQRVVGGVCPLLVR